MNQQRPPFMPGLQLNRLFYWEVVRPILDDAFPGLPHAAALMGYGSDVLGLDTAMSTDHNWGPRLQLFLHLDNLERHRDAIDQTLRQRLPATFRGYSVNFSQPDPNDRGTQLMEATEKGPVNHLLEITAVEPYFRRYLGVAPIDSLTSLDWLLIPEQALLEMTAGQVYHDGLSQLQRARQRFAAYPRDVWLYRIASQWRRIGQEEAFVGRCGDVGDDLGSRIVAARLVRDLMRLAFLLERRYAPYSKWLGSAFARLKCAQLLLPLFEQVLAATEWQARQEPLCRAYVVLAEQHNALGFTDPVPPTISDFFNRPFCVLFADRFADSAKEAIQDPALRQLESDIGAVDQFSDCTDLTENIDLVRRLDVLYR